jgi:hypothetical protein
VQLSLTVLSGACISPCVWGSQCMGPHPHTRRRTRTATAALGDSGARAGECPVPCVLGPAAAGDACGLLMHGARWLGWLAVWALMGAAAAAAAREAGSQRRRAGADLDRRAPRGLHVCSGACVDVHSCASHRVTGLAEPFCVCCREEEALRQPAREHQHGQDLSTWRDASDHGIMAPRTRDEVPPHSLLLQLRGLESPTCT